MIQSFPLRPLFHSLFAAGLFGGILASPGLAQSGGATETIHEIHGHNPYDYLSVGKGAGDVNNDGFDDIIIGARFAQVGGSSDVGSAYVYSGVDGTLMWQYDGSKAYDDFGESVDGAGDVNGDGYADFIIGSGGADPSGVFNAGSVYVYSGSNGALLYQFDGAAAGDGFGSSVAGNWDINNDGTPDFLIGAPNAAPLGAVDAGSVYAYSGATGALLWQFDGPGATARFGWSVAFAGDSNLDGSADMIIGAPYADPFAQVDAGSAFLYSGATGALMNQFDGSAAGDTLGYTVGGGGSFDGDAYSDVMISAPYASPGGSVLAGSVSVYSGATGVLLWQIDGSVDYAALGFSVDCAGDLNGDTIDDMIISALGEDDPNIFGSGTLYLLAGGSGTTMHKIYGTEVYDKMGYGAAAGDVNADGRPDFCIGSPYRGTGGLINNGIVQILTYFPGMSSSAPSLSASAGGTVTFQIDMPTSEAGLSYALLGSASGWGPFTVNGIDIPVTYDWLTTLMATGNAPPVFSGAYGTLDANGDGTTILNMAPGAATAYIGTTFFFSAVSFMPPQAVQMASTAVGLTILN